MRCPAEPLPKLSVADQPVERPLPAFDVGGHQAGGTVPHGVQQRPGGGDDARNAHRRRGSTGARAVSASTTRAVVFSSIVVLAADYLITSLLVKHP